VDYSRHLILYSGGADSTFFIEQEPTACYLLHFSEINTDKTKVATINAHLLERFITVIPLPEGCTGNGGKNMSRMQILDDSFMVFNASIIAVKMGMKGIVVCFNADDTGIDIKSIENVIRRAQPDFEILLPLINLKADVIRERLTSKGKNGLKYVSCMHSNNCGFCPKCIEN